MRARFHLVILGLLLSAFAFSVAPPARSGGLEPFLAHLNDAAKRTPPRCPLLCWDAAEAARSRARVLIHRHEGVRWESLRERLNRQGSHSQNPSNA